jgi:hypothetical protein
MVFSLIRSLVCRFWIVVLWLYWFIFFILYFLCIYLYLIKKKNLDFLCTNMSTKINVMHNISCLLFSSFHCFGYLHIIFSESQNQFEFERVFALYIFMFSNHRFALFIVCNCIAEKKDNCFLEYQNSSFIIGELWPIYCTGHFVPIRQILSKQFFFNFLLYR